MKQVIYILIFVLLSSTLGCEDKQLVVIEIPNEPPKLVVNCLYSPDNQQFYVNVSKSQMVNKEEYYSFDVIENAIIEITPSSFFDSVKYVDNGTYKILLKYRPNQQMNDTAYTLKVSVPDFDTIEVSNTLPKQVPIIESYKSKNGGFFDDDGKEFGEITIEFLDNGIINNYYALNLSLSKDSIAWYPLKFNCNDPVMSDYYNTNLLSGYIMRFNDDLFNGETYLLNILVEKELLDSADFVKVRLYTLSEDYYLYKKTTHLQYEVEQNVFPTVPVQVYTNIEDGYGIFAGYNMPKESGVTLD